MTSSLIRSERTDKGLGGTFPWERVALASGILFVAAQIATVASNVIFFLTTHPPMDASPQETARGFAEHATMVEIGTYLYVLHMPFWLLFLGGLFGVLRKAEGGSGALSVSTLGGGVAMAVIAPIDTIVSSLTSTIVQCGWGRSDGQGHRRYDAARACLERLPMRCAPGSDVCGVAGEPYNTPLDRMGGTRPRPDRPRLAGYAGRSGPVPLPGTRDAAVRGVGSRPHRRAAPEHPNGEPGGATCRRHKPNIQ